MKYKLDCLTKEIEIGVTTRAEAIALIDSEMTESKPKNFKKYQISSVGDKDVIINYRYDYGNEINDEGDLTIGCFTTLVFDDNDTVRCIYTDEVRNLEAVYINNKEYDFVNELADRHPELEDLREDTIGTYNSEAVLVCKNSLTSKNKYLSNYSEASRYNFFEEYYMYKAEGETIMWTNNTNGKERAMYIAKSDDNILEWADRNYFPDVPWYEVEFN